MTNNKLYLGQNPIIDAAGLDDSQAGVWLKEMAEAALSVRGGGVTSFAVTRLPKLADELQVVLDDTSIKINYLESVQITRPADQTISVQEDLQVLRATAQAILDSLQSIETCLPLLRESRGKYWSLFEQVCDQASSEPKKGKSYPDH